MAKKNQKEVRNLQYFKTQEEWENWLKRNSNITQEVWLLQYRPHTDEPSLNNEESLKTAAKYNFKHTLIKRIDDDSYARKFIPVLPETSEKEKPEETPPQPDTAKPDVIAPAAPVTLPPMQDDVFRSKVDKETEIEDEKPLIIDLPEDDAEEASSVEPVAEITDQEAEFPESEELDDEDLIAPLDESIEQEIETEEIQETEDDLEWEEDTLPTTQEESLELDETSDKDKLETEPEIDEEYDEDISIGEVNEKSADAEPDEQDKQPDEQEDTFVRKVTPGKK